MRHLGLVLAALAVALVGACGGGDESGSVTSAGGAAGNAGADGGGSGGTIGGAGGTSGSGGGSGVGGTIGGTGGNTPDGSAGSAGAAGGATDGGDGSAGAEAGECSDGQTEPCYGGPAGTEGVGACAAGTRTCSGGSWGACDGEIVPTTDVCNGVDDDCDALVDEDLGQTTCGLGNCEVTVDNCANGAPQQCSPGQPNPSELCDGTDDDCDGTIDEGCTCTDGATQSCYSGGAGTDGVGECKQGTQTCSGGSWGACVGEVVPVAEACDGLDNDCDGQSDEGDPGGGQTCSTGQSGVCAAGTTSCVAGAIACNQLVQPAAEACDGLDNDCNGQVDDGNPEGGQTCNTGQPGICSAGTTACQNGSLACVPSTTATNETCNGQDDDCDGQIDDGNPGGGQTCNTGQPGICSAGTTSCQNGQLSCNQNTQPTSEVCNGTDDDCDGQVDDGNPGGGVTCSTGLPGVCAVGSTGCSNGQLVCNQLTQPSPETCNGLDDDCDGQSDEGNPGGGVACNTGLPGACAAGTASCAGGSLICNQNVQPTSEVCDGADNDCDGQTDEGNPGGGAPCNTGLSGICANGTSACSGGAIVCNQNNQPTAEACNGADDDCDGQYDEGNPGGGASCGTGLPGICAAGTTTCQSGTLACNQNQQPTSEICSNTLDDDCDGQVNDGCSGGGCSHGKCVTGAALVSGCEPCVTQICAADPWCCNNDWDSLCVQEVRTICDSLTCPEAQGSCSHSLCTTGSALVNNCDNAQSDCVEQVCAADAWCCTNSWDTLCVNQVASVCGMNCN